MAIHHEDQTEHAAEITPKICIGSAKRSPSAATLWMKSTSKCRIKQPTLHHDRQQKKRTNLQRGRTVPHHRNGLGRSHPLQSDRGSVQFVGNRCYSAHEEITERQIVPTLAPPRFRPGNKTSEVAPKGRPPSLLSHSVQAQKQIAHSRIRK